MFRAEAQSFDVWVGRETTHRVTFGAVLPAQVTWMVLWFAGRGVCFFPAIFALPNTASPRQTTVKAFISAVTTMWFAIVGHGVGGLGVS